MPPNPLLQVAKWFAQRGARSVPKQYSVISNLDDPVNAAIVRSYTDKMSTPLNRVLTGHADEQVMKAYADELGVPVSELIARMRGMADASTVEKSVPTFSGLSSPRYPELLRGSSELPMFLSTTPDIKKTAGWADQGVAGFKTPGRGINPGQAQRFSDEQELILPQGRPLELMDYTEFDVGRKNRLPVMLFKKHGGLVQMKECNCG